MDIKAYIFNLERVIVGRYKYHYPGWGQLIEKLEVVLCEILSEAGHVIHEFKNFKLENIVSMK